MPEQSSTVTWSTMLDTLLNPSLIPATPVGVAILPSATRTLLVSSLLIVILPVSANLLALSSIFVSSLFSSLFSLTSKPMAETGLNLFSATLISADLPSLASVASLASASFASLASASTSSASRASN